MNSDSDDSDNADEDETGNGKSAKAKKRTVAAAKSTDEKESLSMKYPGVFVTETNDRDVLQGRGSGSNLYQGNLVYRDMIEDVATSYTTTTSRKEKNRLVKDLIKGIHDMKGRFLHPVDSEEAGKFGLDSDKNYYYEITDADAVDKVKQAIRYVHYKKRPLLEQRRRASLDRGGSSTFSGEDKRKMPPTGAVSDSTNADIDASVHPLLQGLSVVAPSQLQLLRQGLLQQQHLHSAPSSTRRTSEDPSRSPSIRSASGSMPDSSSQSQSHHPYDRSNTSNVNLTAPNTQTSMLNVLTGLHQQRNGDEGHLRQILEQQVLLQHLQKLQEEQQQQQQLLQHKEQQQLIQTLLRVQQPQSGSQSDQLVSVLLQQPQTQPQLPVVNGLSDAVQSQIQQLLLQRLQQQQQLQETQPLPVQEQINQILLQQQLNVPAGSNVVQGPTVAGRSATVHTDAIMFGDDRKRPSHDRKRPGKSGRDDNHKHGKK